MKLRQKILVVALATACSSMLFAKPTPEEVARLGGPVLTEFGAERAGNKEGTIPAYTGGLGPDNIKVPGADPKGCKLPDPYPNDRPLFSISSKNMDQHADKLSEVAKTLMKRHPEFTIDVYPTRRNQSYPKWLLENTVKNAARPSLTANGDSLHNAHLQIPFPIPKSGYEVAWNHNLRYRGGIGRPYDISSYFIDASGRLTLTGKYLSIGENQYWNRKLSDEEYWKYPLYTRQLTWTLDGRTTGENSLFVRTMDFNKFPERSWVYQPGQRRVRAAPDYSYDYPMPSQGGIQTIDQNEGGIYGRLDRYSLKLIGKKEMYTPANSYEADFYLPIDALINANNRQVQSNKAMKFELRRVWVVEMTLKPEFRHIYSKKVIYFDEDSWATVMDDNYDMQGKLFRGGFWPTTADYVTQSLVHNYGTFYDLSSGAWLISSMKGFPGGSGACVREESWPNNFFTPEALQSRGIR